MSDAVTPSKSTLKQVQNGGSVGFGGVSGGEPYYEWSGASKPGSGLQMNISLADPANYSVGLRFSFGIDNFVGYRKIVDFKKGTNDDGVYLHYGKIMFYLGAAQTPLKDVIVKKDEVVDILMTRNKATKQFTVYSVSTIGGETALTTIFTLVDPNNSTIPLLDGTQYRFGFGYDEIGGPEFASAGKIFAIKAWDKALTKDEIVASMKQPGFTYNGNGATNGSIADSVTRFNQSVTLPSDGFTRNDCTFIGWNTKPDGTGTAYTAGQTVTNVQVFTTFYAQWQANEQGALFVSPDGSVDGTGTILSPFATLEQAYTAASSTGSTIYLLGNLEIKKKTSFNADKIITIKSWESAQYSLKRVAADTPDEQTTFLRSNLFEIESGTVNLSDVIIDNGAIWGEGGVNNGIATTTSAVSVIKSAQLKLLSGAVIKNSASGAVLASGTAKILFDGATVQGTSAIGAGISLAEQSELTMNSGAIRGCRAGNMGGAISLYGSGGNTAKAHLNGGVIENNSASGFASGILVNGGGQLNLNPNGMTITGDIGLLSATNPIKVTQAPTGTKTFTVNINPLPTDGSMPKIVDGAELSDVEGSYGGDVLKPHFKIANSGWTFGYKQQPQYSAFDDASALYLVQVTAPAAVVFDGSVATAYHSIQAAIDAVPANGTQTIYVLSVANPAESKYTIYDTLTVKNGRNITFGSATVTLDTNDSDGITHTYVKNADGTQTTVMRGSSLSNVMVRVEAGSFCTANNIIFDGGAIWGTDGNIAITGVDNTYYVKTNNTGVKANAPVFAVAGNFVLGNLASIQNNENTYLKFGSEQYGGGVRVSGAGASFTMQGGSTISKCYSREGGAIMNVTKFINAGKDTTGSIVIISGGTIEGCVSQTKGSAIQTIYGNSVTQVNGGTISGVKPYETNFGVLTVEEGGKLLIADGNVSNTNSSNFAVYAYNDYCNNYGGYLEGNHAAQLEIGNATIGKIGLDASGTAQTSGNHTEQRPNLKEKYDIYIVNSSATNASTYDVTLAGNWSLGNLIVQNKKSNFTFNGLPSNLYEYLLSADLVVGGMEITQAIVNSDGTVSVSGKFIGTPANLSVTVGGIAAVPTVNDDGTFTAVTATAVPAGKKEVILSYSIGNHTLTSKMLITVPEKNLDGVLTGEVDYGTLESGEKLQYLGTDGVYHDLLSKQLPEDIKIDANGYADFKLVDSLGDEYTYRAFVGARITTTPPSDAIFGEDNISKTDTTISIATEEGYEYQLVDSSGNIVTLNGNQWSAGTGGELTFTGLNPDETYTVLAREKGTDTNQPGVAKAVDVKTKTALQQKIDEAKAELDEAAKIAKEEIDKLANLSAEEKAAAKTAIDEANAAAKTVVEGKTTVAEVNTAANEGKAAITSVVDDAKSLAAQNLADAKKAAKDELDKFISDNCPSDNYSTEEYAKLVNKVNTAKTAIDGAANISELKDLLSNAYADVKTVPSKAPAPVIDKAGDRLTGLSTGTYTVTSGGETYTFTVGADGVLPLQGKDKDGKAYDFASKTINITQKGENGFADSSSAAVTLPERVVKPENVPASGLTADKDSITVKKDTVVDGNKYAVVDKDGNIVGEWVTGKSGEDIVFEGLESETDYRVIVIGKNQAEPDKLPSNPTEGTAVQTKAATEEGKNYVWVILCSIFGALLVAEIIFLIFKRRKKDGEDKGGNTKLNCAALPVLAIFASAIVAPVAGPVIFSLVVVAMVAVPLTMHFLNKRNKNDEVGKDEPQALQDDSAPEENKANDKQEKTENIQINISVKEENVSDALTHNVAVQTDEEQEAAEEKRRAEALAQKNKQAEALSAMNAEQAAKRESENAAARERERKLLLVKAEEERKIRFAEAEQAKARGEVLAGFRLSRQDVLDRVEEMAENRFDFPVEPFVKTRQSERFCDSLKCGEWAFGVMFESKSEVIKFMLRLDKDYANSLKAAHGGIVPTGFANGEDWYKVIIDGTFYAKSEVFAILDSAYAYVMNDKYKFEPVSKTYKTDVAAAQADEKTVESIAAATAKPDPEVAKVEKAREELDVLLLANLKFKTSKKEISAAAKSVLSVEETEIAERENATSTHLPLADTFYTLNGISDKGAKKKVCFAYTYQLKDDSIKIIAKLPRVYAEKQAAKHGTLCRSKFPAGKGWYVFKLDGTFGTMDELLAVIKKAKAYAESKEDRE